MTTLYRIVFVITTLLIGTARAAGDARSSGGDEHAGAQWETAAVWGDHEVDVPSTILLADYCGNGGDAHSATPAADDACTCICCSRSARGYPHATALLRVATMLGSQGGGEEAGGAWPGWYGRQRGVDQDCRAVATIPCGPDLQHGGGRQGVDRAAAVSSEAPGRVSTTASYAAVAAHHYYREEGRNDSTHHRRNDIRRMDRRRGGGGIVGAMTG